MHIYPRYSIGMTSIPTKTEDRYTALLPFKMSRLSEAPKQDGPVMGELNPRRSLNQLCSVTISLPASWNSLLRSEA